MARIKTLWFITMCPYEMSLKGLSIPNFLDQPSVDFQYLKKYSTWLLANMFTIIAGRCPTHMSINPTYPLTPIRTKWLAGWSHCLIPYQLVTFPLMYTYIYICMYVCIYIYYFKYVYIVYMYMFLNHEGPFCIYIYIHINMCKNKWIHIYIYINMYMCICKYIYIYMVFYICRCHHWLQLPSKC